MPRMSDDLGINLAIWGGAGTALGIAMGNLGLWIAIGVAIGVTLTLTRNKAG